MEGLDAVRGKPKGLQRRAFGLRKRPVERLGRNPERGPDPVEAFGVGEKGGIPVQAHLAEDVRDDRRDILGLGALGGQERPEALPEIPCGPVKSYGQGSPP